MTRRLTVWCVLLIVGLVLAVIVPPQSPMCFVHWFVHENQFEGRSVAAWMRQLQSGDARQRSRAAFALGALGPRAAPAVPLLASMMNEEKDPELRRQASLALSKIGSASITAIDELTAALSDEDAAVRMNAAVTLQRLGPEAKTAIPALLKAIHDPENQHYFGTYVVSVQEAAVLALGRIGDPDVVPDLIAALDAPSVDRLPIAIARAIEQIGPEAKQAIPRLREMLSDEDLEVREAATRALVRLGQSVEPPQASPEPELLEADRKWLWEVENHGNQLNKYGFAPLARALRAADRNALRQALAATFTASEAASPQRVTVDRPFVSLLRWKEAGQPLHSLSAEGFLDRLLDWRNQFTQTPNVSLVMATLHPREREQPDGIWQGKALLRLHGESKPGMPTEITATLRFETVRPTRENLSKPGWWHSAALVQVQSASSPHFLFVESAAQRGFELAALHDNWHAPAFHASTGGVYVCDFDRDGYLDVLVTDVNTTALYRGGPDGRFTNVTAKVGLPDHELFRPPAAWIDLDGDGWEDLLIGHRIFRNLNGERFEEYTDRSNLRLPEDVSNYVVADYDRDGHVDFYIARSGKLRGNSWLEGKSGSRKGNVLIRNKGNWRFENVTHAAGVSGDRRSTFTAAWLDANNDGWPDLHVINEFGDGVLYVNRRNGTFSAHALADRPADFGSMGLAVGDVDNDGHIDIFCNNMYSKAGTRVINNLPKNAYPDELMEKMRRFVAGSQLHRNKGGLKFEQVGEERHVAVVGWSYGAALADLDNDGWLDLYGTAGYISRDRNEPDG